MDDNGDENNFSDDDLDALPTSTLFQLEQIAIRSTQQSPTHDNVYPNVNRKGPGSPQRLALQARQQQPAQAQPRVWQSGTQPHYAQETTGSFDGQVYDDEGVATPVEEKESFIPKKVPSETTQREQWRPNRFSKQIARSNHVRVQEERQPRHRDHQQPMQKNSGHLDLSRDGGLQESMLVSDRPPVSYGAIRSAEEESLRSQIDALMRERDSLTTELRAANSTVLTQKGEISIIRANQSRESKTFDRQLSVLKKSAQDEALQHKARLEMMQAESKKLSTENQFLKHDLQEEVDKNKAMQKSLKEKPTVERTERSERTPPKSHAHSLRDGFDDGELLVVSPSKSVGRSKGGTPTAGGKRKRKVDVQSPIPPLALRQSSGPVQPQAAEAMQPPAADRIVPVVKKDVTAEKNLRFLQKVLNHRIADKSERIVEAFMRHTFPSEPGKTFTTIILEATAGLGGKRLPADLLHVFVELWSRSLREKYYRCISSLADTVSFIINLEISVIDSTTIPKLLAVLQSSGEINGTIRFKHSPVSSQNFGKFTQTPPTELNHEVDETVCLELLYSIASLCVDDDARIECFWRSMTMDFVLMMLNSSQPIPQITQMLNLLSTSILPSTFSVIFDTEDEQSKVEAYVIDRVSYLLWEAPRVDAGEPVPSKSQICHLRLETMALLTHLAITSSPHPHHHPTHHGSVILARHRSAIGRLVRSVYDEVFSMYETSMLPSHHLHADLVNQGIKLLYHLLQDHGESIDMQQKLLAVNGGVHRHRVVLTRLAFSEDGSCLDGGVTRETVEMATEMLEDSVTPEEAEMLIEAFPGYGSNSSSTGNRRSEDPR